MKCNTVTISTEQYNELRDFKLYIEKKYTYRYSYLSGYFITTNEALSELQDEVKKLEDMNTKFRNEIREGYNRYIETDKKKITDMSLIGFIKERRRFRKQLKNKL